jgi:hypothetical protein
MSLNKSRNGFIDWKDDILETYYEMETDGTIIPVDYDDDKNFTEKVQLTFA